MRETNLQNHFFKIQFFSAEKLEKTDIFPALWDICAKKRNKSLFLLVKIFL